MASERAKKKKKKNYLLETNNFKNNKGVGVHDISIRQKSNLPGPVLISLALVLMMSKVLGICRQLLVL